MDAFTSFITVYDKNSTAYAHVGFFKDMESCVVKFYRSNRIKKPRTVWTENPNSFISKKFFEISQQEKTKKEYKERKLVVGDILASTSGSQVFFFRVTELVGKQSVKLENLAGKIVKGTSYEGEMIPDLDVPGEPMNGTFRATGYNAMAKTTRGHRIKAYHWSGNPIWFTINFD